VDFKTSIQERLARERAVIVHKSKVALTWIGGTRQSLTMKIRKVTQAVSVAWTDGDVQYAIPGLVGNDPDIACVTGIRPLLNQARTGFRCGGTGDSLETDIIPGPSDLRDCPLPGLRDKNPATSLRSREGRRDFNIPSPVK
jgi:hypothetical protein